MNYREGITLASALLITSLMLSGCGNFKCASEWRTVVHEWEAIAHETETKALKDEALTRASRTNPRVCEVIANEWEAVASKASVRASEARTKTRALRSNE